MEDVLGAEDETTKKICMEIYKEKKREELKGPYIRAKRKLYQDMSRNGEFSYMRVDDVKDGKVKN